MAHKLQRAISAEGSTALMMRGNGYGTNWRGFYDLNLMSAQLAWRDRSRELPPTVMAQMLIGRYMERFHGGLLYGKARNLSRRLRRDYDAAFNRVDLLAVPTNPIVAQPIVAPDAELETKLGLSDNMAVNTAAFNVTDIRQCPSRRLGQWPADRSHAGRSAQQGRQNLSSRCCVRAKRRMALVELGARCCPASASISRAGWAVIMSEQGSKSVTSTGLLGSVTATTLWEKIMSYLVIGNPMEGVRTITLNRGAKRWR